MTWSQCGLEHVFKGASTALVGTVECACRSHSPPLWWRGCTMLGGCGWTASSGSWLRWFRPHCCLRRGLLKAGLPLATLSLSDENVETTLCLLFDKYICVYVCLWFDMPGTIWKVILMILEYLCSRSNIVWFYTHVHTLMCICTKFCF